MFKVSEPSSLLHCLKAKTQLSGRVIKEALSKGGCLVNGQLETFSTRKLVRGDLVSFTLPQPEEKKELSIIYQDRFFTCFNKPEGMLSEAISGFHLLHRLDKGTSGLLLMTKDLKIKKTFEELFKKREIEKTYIAWVKGIPSKKEGRIESLVAEKGAFSGQTIYGSAGEGVRALTHWKLLKIQRECSLIELHPETGRTHQLRVHMAEMGHPILGDLQYGREEGADILEKRLFLHAYQLEFKHPHSGKKVKLIAPIPNAFKTLAR